MVIPQPVTTQLVIPHMGQIHARVPSDQVIDRQALKLTGRGEMVLGGIQSHPPLVKFGYSRTCRDMVDLIRREHRRHIRTQSPQHPDPSTTQQQQQQTPTLQPATQQTSRVPQTNNNNDDNDSGGGNSDSTALTKQPPALVRESSDFIAPSPIPARCRQASESSVASVNLLEHMKDDTYFANFHARPRIGSVSVRTDVDMQIHYNFHTDFTLEGREFFCSGCQQIILFGPTARHSQYHFCSYIGKQFCSNCHVGDKRTIPASIVQRWLFKPSPVCKLARDFLDETFDKPCVDLREASPSVMSNATVKALMKLRLQLSIQKEYIVTCKEQIAGELMALVMPHMFLLASEPYIFTMQSLDQANQGEFLVKLKSITACYSQHIRHCKLCLGKGDFCEALTNGTCVTRDERLIFPFETEVIKKCPECRALFHAPCFKGTHACPKCARRNKLRLVKK
eukprot:c6067_g1_i1.p1 GENE.c6067_g1_i1~~c6067_g1_i1.p1  ORF type:complete len:452 (-),score=90.50 c6067_g1_i1:142-1497(-)